MKRLVKVLKDLIAKAEKEVLKLAPFVGIACPGVTNSDGSMRRALRTYRQLGQQPVQLAGKLIQRMPQIGEHDMAMVMHNDGAVGLFEVPSRGTGVGNARFTNRNGKGER